MVHSCIVIENFEGDVTTFPKEHLHEYLMLNDNRTEALDPEDETIWENFTREPLQLCLPSIHYCACEEKEEEEDESN